MPLVVITVPTLATANAGAQATVTADPTGSESNGPPGTVYAIDVTLAGRADLGGKRITVSNPGGSQVDFFAAPPATPLPSIGDVFDGTLPSFPRHLIPRAMVRTSRGHFRTNGAGESEFRACRRG